MAFSCMPGSYTRKLQVAESTNFILSFATIHFLTQSVPTLDSFSLADTKASSVKIANAVFAAKDLDNCLTARAFELKPGGYFISTNCKTFPEAWNTPLTHTLQSLIEEGTYKEEEGLKMNFAIATRDIHDYEDSIRRTGGFEIVEHCPIELNIPFIIEDQINHMKALTEVRIRNALRETRAEHEVEPLVSEFYKRLASYENFQTHYYTEFQYCVLRKLE